jgi:hypothetical protein
MKENKQRDDGQELEASMPIIGRGFVVVGGPEPETIGIILPGFERGSGVSKETGDITQEKPKRGFIVEGGPEPETIGIILPGLDRD